MSGIGIEHNSSINMLVHRSHDHVFIMIGSGQHKIYNSIDYISTKCITNELQYYGFQCIKRSLMANNININPDVCLPA